MIVWINVDDVCITFISFCVAFVSFSVLFITIFIIDPYPVVSYLSRIGVTSMRWLTKDADNSDLYTKYPQRKYAVI